MTLCFAVHKEFGFDLCKLQFRIASACSVSSAVFSMMPRLRFILSQWNVYTIQIIVSVIFL